MAPRRPGTQPTEVDPTLDIGAKRARVVGEDESSTQVRLRARTRACKPACTIIAHILAWLLLWRSVRRRGSLPLPQRDVSAAKTPSGVAAPPFNTSASAVHYQSLRKRNRLQALERSADPCALSQSCYDIPRTQPPEDTHPYCPSVPLRTLWFFAMHWISFDPQPKSSPAMTRRMPL